MVRQMIPEVLVMPFVPDDSPVDSIDRFFIGPGSCFTFLLGLFVSRKKMGINADPRDAVALPDDLQTTGLAVRLTQVRIHLQPDAQELGIIRGSLPLIRRCSLNHSKRIGRPDL